MSNDEFNTVEIARVAANIEDNFNSELGYESSAKDAKGVGETMFTKDGNSYQILAEFNFPNSEDGCQKAVVLKKGDEIYFHFNGTGDGNWVQNAAAYGAEPQPSDLQAKSAEWFDKTYEELASRGIINDSSNIYVTGHSQGGNNAMFVTMRSEYADKIDICVPLDGPGFSNKFVSDTMGMLGKDEYDQRRNKIWAYNGEHDFVSILGQQSIVPDEHTKYIKYSKDKVDIMDFHCSGGLIDDNGNFTDVLDYDSPIRKRLASAVEKIKELPQEDQALAAKVIMAIIENVPKDDEPRTEAINPEDFERIKPALIPFLIELLAYYPDEISETLQYVLGLDEELANSIEDLVIKLNSYPVEYREEILKGALNLVKVDENGKISFDSSGIPKLLIESLPILAETVLTNPDDLWNVVKNLGIDEVVGNWVLEHPWETVGMIALFSYFAPYLIPFLTEAGVIIFSAALLVDIGIRIIQGLVELADDIKNKIVDFIESVKSTYEKFRKWLRQTFNKGAKYASGHPYFKADTDLLYSYASRLSNVNSRLRNLDSGMRSLYWQVGFLDLWDILCANLITSESTSLNMARNYLSDTADRLSRADNKAKELLEG